MNVPDSMKAAADARTAIALRSGTDTDEAPRVVRHEPRSTNEDANVIESESTLWVLEGFTLASARRFLDNYLEPFGYAPMVDNPNVWTALGGDASDSGEELRE